MKRQSVDEVRRARRRRLEWGRGEWVPKFSLPVPPAVEWEEMYATLCMKLKER